MDKNRVNHLLEDIAEELNIPEGTLKKAVNSYDALAEYINNNADFSVNVFPQGSVRLGTAIKPIKDGDDYDIDLVCYVKGNVQTPSLLKNMVGDVLKSSDRYSKLLLPEGRRCWTLQYSEDTHFHMDVLPATHGDNMSEEPMTITDKENMFYSFQSSNPKGYAKWFDRKQRGGETFHTLSIEKINSSKNKSVLQKAVQLLKRHRDIMYAGKPENEQDNKPISIIITTVAAELYKGNETLLSMIEKFAELWTQCFSRDIYGNHVLKNPVDPKENFADKWMEHPERKEAFIEWVNKLREDILEKNFVGLTDNVKEAEHLQSVFGKSVVMEAYKRNRTGYDTLFVDSSKSAASITADKTDIPVKRHTFYGK